MFSGDGTIYFPFNPATPTLTFPATIGDMATLTCAGLSYLVTDFDMGVEACQNADNGPAASESAFLTYVANGYSRTMVKIFPQLLTIFQEILSKNLALKKCEGSNTLQMAVQLDCEKFLGSEHIIPSGLVIPTPTTYSDTHV